MQSPIGGFSPNVTNSPAREEPAPFIYNVAQDERISSKKGKGKKLFVILIIIVLIGGAGAAYWYFFLKQPEFVGKWQHGESDPIHFKENGDLCAFSADSESCYATWEEDGDYILLEMKENDEWAKLDWKMDGDNLMLRVAENEDGAVADAEWTTLTPFKASTSAPKQNQEIDIPLMMGMDAEDNLTNESDDQLLVLTVISDDEVKWNDIFIRIIIDNGTEIECSNPNQNSDGNECELSWSGTGDTIKKNDNITISESGTDLCNSECWIEYRIGGINSPVSKGGSRTIS